MRLCSGVRDRAVASRSEPSRARQSVTQFNYSVWKTDGKKKTSKSGQTRDGVGRGGSAHASSDHTSRNQNIEYTTQQRYDGSNGESPLCAPSQSSGNGNGAVRWYISTGWHVANTTITGTRLAVL